MSSRRVVYNCDLYEVWTVELFGEDGRLKDRREVHNLLVSAGLAYLAGLVSGANSTLPDYLAIGTGATAPAAGDTTLQTEGCTRVQGTNSRVQTTVANDTAQCAGTFAAANGTGAVTEVGRLTASTSGTLVSRATFAAINKAAADTLAVTHKIVFANAA